MMLLQAPQTSGFVGASSHLSPQSRPSTRSLGISLFTPTTSLSSCSSNNGEFRVSGLGQSIPWKRTRVPVVRAVGGVDGKVNGTLRGSRREPKVVNMVDPLEAKRLAAEEWRLLEARAKFQRRREIEAINGGWAMLGLTAGIVVEGLTGKGILLQVAGYLDSLADFLAQLTPSP